MDLIYSAPIECGGTAAAANYNSTLQVLPDREPVEQQITYYVPDPPPPPTPSTSTTSTSGATVDSGLSCPDRVRVDEDGQIFVDGQPLPSGVNSVPTCLTTTITYSPGTDDTYGRQR